MKYHQAFIGEYQVEKTLERSQYSVLCQGKKSATGQEVLLKLWLTAQVDSEKKQARVREEVAALQALNHPHLLPLLEVQVDAQKVFLVCEAAPSGSLNGRLKQKNGEAFPLDETLQVIGQTGQALQELHAHGIVHGNLTPQAIFFSGSGQVKLGEVLIRSVLASIQDYQHILDENVPHCFYMAPERFRGRIDTKTDQYALGCLAYVLLTGCVPFSGSARATLLQKHLRDQPRALTALNPTVPVHIEATVLRSLAKNPKKRYSSVQAFLEALDVSGKKRLADQNTVKQAVPGTLLEKAEIAGEEIAVPLEGLLQTFHPTTTADGRAQYPLPVSSPIGRSRPGRRGPFSQKRARYAIVPAILLVVALLFVMGRWLFFPGGPGVAHTNGSVQSVPSTAAFPTSAVVTHTQTTATRIATPPAWFTPTSTPTPPPRPSVTPSPTATTTPAQLLVSLTSFFNNKGIGSGPGQANFDGSGYSYPANQLPSGGLITVNGVSYQFLGNAPGTNDNLIASGQTIPLAPGKYRQAFLLAAASWGPRSGTVTVHYTDGSTTTTTITVLDWYQGPPNGLSTTERYTPNGIDHHAVFLYVIPLTLNVTRRADALLLPGSQSGPYENGHIHVFSLTLLH